MTSKAQQFADRLVAEPSAEVKQLIAALAAAAHDVSADHGPFDYIGLNNLLHHDEVNCPRCRYKAARLALVDWLNEQRNGQWHDRRWPFNDCDYERRDAIRDGERALTKYRRR